MEATFNPKGVPLPTPAGQRLNFSFTPGRTLKRNVAGVFDLD
jgi:hypothetical protein